jgi:hypothetical protein
MFSCISFSRTGTYVGLATDGFGKVVATGAGAGAGAGIGLIAAADVDAFAAGFFTGSTGAIPESF